MKRVTGIGGIFFKADDPKKLKSWYEKHLDVKDVFQWKEIGREDAAEPAQTAWAPFKSDTDYFSPSKKSFMVNYRVENLEDLLKVLKEEGVEVVGDIQTYSYGKFGWILDPEGNKIELWEPID